MARPRTYTQKEAKERDRIRKLKWSRENKNYYKQYHKKRNQKDEIRLQNNAKQRANKARYYRENPGYKLIHNLRIRMRKAIKGIHKFHHMSEIIGLSKEDFTSHIEKLWSSDMTWDNYGRGVGKWGIDHIAPCTSFDMTSPEGQHACFHYENMQPMWHIENSRKGNRIV